MTVTDWIYIYKSLGNTDNTPTDGTGDQIVNSQFIS